MVRPTTLVVSGIIIIMLAITMWWGFPKLLDSQIKKKKYLRKGSEGRAVWSNLPMALDFKMYLWNVTNPDDIYKGAKPEVKEVGPFFYREWKSKTNFEDNPDEDTVSYNLVNTFYFDEKETKPLTGNETITVPHLLILVLAQVILETKPAALNMLNKGMPYIFNDPKSIFIQTTPRELLFDGITLNCTKVKEFAANTLCDQIRANPKGLKQENDDIFKFSIFGPVNGTVNENTITVKRGVQNIQEVGQVVRYNGKSEMDFWTGMPCNQIKGTDTTVFPPYMSREKPPDVWGFGAEVCRSMKSYYVGPKTYRGIRGLAYSADFGDMSTDPELKCFCPTETTCLKKGAFDLFKCTGAPLIATLPHCYGCDSSYQNMVKGCDPNFTKHGIISTFEPITGNPVEGHRRMQFNIWLYNVSKVAILKDLPTEKVLFPIVWLDEGIELNETICGKVRHLLYRPIKMVRVGKYVLIAFSFLLFGMAVYVHYKRSKLLPGKSEGNITTITQVSPVY